MSKTANVNDLFKAAYEEGDLSAKSMQVLTGTLDVGAQIQAGLGMAAEDVQASEVVLVTMMPDDSGSIRFSGNAQLVRDGHNLVLSSLKESKQMDSILCHTRYLNGTVLFPYAQMDNAVEMDSHNYDPNLGTPLFDQSVIVLGTVLAKSKEFEDAGIPVRSITLLITDGQDQHSNGGPLNVKVLAEDMLKKENHIIAGMEIDDGSGSCKGMFKAMGIRDEWILSPGDSKGEIRKAFQVFSQSAVRASQNAASFSKTAMGGFGA